MTRARVAWAGLYTVILATGVTLGIRIVVDGYSPVPVADLWAMFPFIERGVQGDFGLADLWAQHNEHRMALARLQFLVDYRFFEGTNVFLFVSIATTCLLLAMIFCAAAFLETSDWLIALGTLAVAGASALPLAGSENLALAVNVAFVQAFLFATVSILAIVMAAHSTVAARQAAWVAVAGLTAFAATYALANGLTAWLVVLALAVVLRLDRRHTALLTIAGVLTAATYLWHFEFVGEPRFTRPLDLAHYVLLYIGAAPTPNPGTAAIAGAIGLVLFALLCRMVWRERRDRSILVPFGGGVSTFIVLTAAQTAGGRLEFGVTQALESRYSIASYTFWLGLFVGYIPAVHARLRAADWAFPAYLAAAALLSVALGYGASPKSGELRADVVGRQATVVAHRVGVEDDTLSIPGVQFVWTPVTEGLRWLERERLGPWKPGGMADRMRVPGPVGRPNRTCRGKMDAAESVRGGSRIGGWIAPESGEASSPNLVVLNARGRGVGLGVVGFHRTDVNEPGLADADWRGFVGYVRGTPSGPLDVVLLTQDGDEEICRLTVSGRPPA